MAKKYKKVAPNVPKISINSLRNLKQYQKMIIPPNAAKREIASYLLREGGFIITAAYHNRGFNNRTYNLHDSYVAAVFIDGDLYGKKFVGEEKSEVQDKKTGTSGREEAEKFIEVVQRTVPKDGVRLVIAAAMYYSGIVESRGYQVLSQVGIELEELIGRSMDAAKYLAHVKLEEITEASIYREGGYGGMQIVNM